MNKELQEIRELLAAQEHERWSGWMHYLFSLCVENSYGDLTIPMPKVGHWQRQIDTPYAELSEKEKDSDRKEADKTLELVGGIVDTQAEQIGIVEQERDLRSTEKEHLWDEYNRLEKQLAAGREIVESLEFRLVRAGDEEKLIEICPECGGTKEHASRCKLDAWLKEVADGK